VSAGAGAHGGWLRRVKLTEVAGRGRTCRRAPNPRPSPRSPRSFRLSPKAEMAPRHPTQALGVAAVASAANVALSVAVRGPAHAAAGRQRHARRAVRVVVARAVRQRDVVCFRVKDVARTQHAAAAANGDFARLARGSSAVAHTAADRPKVRVYKSSTAAPRWPPPSECIARVLSLALCRPARLLCGRRSPHRPLSAAKRATTVHRSEPPEPRS
jgi:hypothetical protein